MASSGARPPPPDPVFLPWRVCTSSTDAQRCAGVDLPTLHRRIRRQGWHRPPYYRRPGATRPTGLDPWPWTRPGRAPYATFVAGTSIPLQSTYHECEHLRYSSPQIRFRLVMIAFPQHHSRHRYARLRTSRTATASYPLTLAPAHAITLFDNILTTIQRPPESAPRSGTPSQSTTPFVAEKTGRDFFELSNVRTQAKSTRVNQPLPLRSLVVGDVNCRRRHRYAKVRVQHTRATFHPAYPNPAHKPKHRICTFKTASLAPCTSPPHNCQLEFTLIFLVSKSMPTNWPVRDLFSNGAIRLFHTILGIAP